MFYSLVWKLVTAAMIQFIWWDIQLSSTKTVNGVNSVHIVLLDHVNTAMISAADDPSANFYNHEEGPY